MMKKPPLGRKLLPPQSGYAFFLPDLLGDGHTGRTLPEEEYVTAYLERLAQMPRCADPRCNQEFDPARADQRYCQKTCGDRHRARMYYREQNGLPDDPPVATEANPAQREADLRRLLALAKSEIDRRPELLPVRNADGKLIPQAYVLAEKQAREKLDEYSRFKYDMRKAGFAMVDFWKDQALELFELWKADGEQLPFDSEIVARRNEEAYRERLADENFNKLHEQAERARCAALFPSMDRVQGDGSLRPE